MMSIDIASLSKQLKDIKLFQDGKSQEDFWDNEHISKQMLDAHLNPDWDAASRKEQFIDASYKWIISSLGLKKNDKIVDLGCGPGLYCSRFSEYGLKVTGIDYSKRSIEYAKKKALESNLPIEYIYENYMNIDYTNEYDLAVMIYCDFGCFSSIDSRRILNKIHKALKPNGYFIFDVWTPFNLEVNSEYKRWSVRNEGGFWSSSPYIELENKTYYSDEDVSLKQHVIILEDGTSNIYNLWERRYTIESMKALLNECGFEVEGIYNDLTGKEYQKDSGTLGIVARKA